MYGQIEWRHKSEAWFLFLFLTWLFCSVRNESRTVALWTSSCQPFICMQKHPFIILNGNRTICLGLHYFLNSSWLALFSNVYVTQLWAAFNKSMCAFQVRVLHYTWRFPLGYMEMCPLVFSSIGENPVRLSTLAERFKRFWSFTMPSCLIKTIIS